MADWVKVIEENEEKIKEACFEADKEAYANTNIQLTLYLQENGEVYTFEDVAGENSEPASAWKGEDFAISTFCHQYYSVLDDVTNETIIDYLPDGKDYMGEYKKYLAEEDEEDESGKFVEWLKENYENELNEAGMEIFCEDISPEDYSQYVEQAIERAEQLKV